MLGGAPQQLKAAYFAIAQQLLNLQEELDTVAADGYSLCCRFPCQQPPQELFIGLRKIELLDLHLMAVEHHLGSPRGQVQ